MRWAMFPGTLKRLPPDQDEAAGCYPAVHLHTLIAVGQLGVVGPPGPDGIQEIGYGFNPEVWGQGLATESVTALSTHLLTWDDITAVTAKTATTNPASGRVVEKAGFNRVGADWTNDDGDLVSWQFGPIADAT